MADVCNLTPTNIQCGTTTESVQLGQKRGESLPKITVQKRQIKISLFVIKKVHIPSDEPKTNR